jgi:hypothetical protein
MAFFYFAHGSNTMPTRLFERFPSSKIVGLGVLQKFVKAVGFPPCGDNACALPEQPLCCGHAFYGYWQIGGARSANRR